MVGGEVVEDDVEDVVVIVMECVDVEFDVFVVGFVEVVDVENFVGVFGD